MTIAEKTINMRDVKLVQWLGEAHAKEAELEVDLAAHIALTEKATYKKRLQEHLKQTREHKRSVAKRIRELGGDPTGGPEIRGVPTAVTGAAGKAVSAVKGQVGAVRALLTDQAETHVRNVQEELREEHVEIALYTRIEVFADEVGDRDTAQLARRIRREEERMAKYLSSQLEVLVRELVRASVPRELRTKSGSSSRSTSRTARTTTPRTAARRSRSGGTASATTKRRSTASGPAKRRSTARSGRS